MTVANVVRARLLLGAILLALGPHELYAQQEGSPRPPIIVGPSAGLAFSRVSLAVSNGPSETERLLAMQIGLTLAPFARLCSRRGGFCGELSGVRITPQLAFAATHFRGLSPDSDPYSFAYFHLLGGKVSYPLLARLRPFVVFSHGSVSSERFEAVPYGNDVVNYIGNGTTSGIGVEIPMVRSGRGFQLSLSRISGRFEERELWDRAANAKVFVSANVPFRAYTFQLGWSGPFTGVSLPWQ